MRRELVSILQSMPEDEATSWETRVPTHWVLVDVGVFTVGEELVVETRSAPRCGFSGYPEGKS